jgi:SAM-dependent methyltransferase
MVEVKLPPTASAVARPALGLAPEFSPERRRLLERIERDHFWFVSRRAVFEQVISRFLPRPVALLVDVGCGTGFNLGLWSRFAGRVLGVDRQFAGGASQAGTALRIASDVENLPLVAAAADAVVALDVLEHVDDVRALTEVHRILKPGGYLFLSVPAMPWLWSYRDEAAGHRRRYSRSGLRETVEGANFHVRLSIFFQALIFPVFILSRLFGRRGPSLRDFEDRPAPWVAVPIGLINALELRLLRSGITLPWGSSLVLVAQKLPESP